MYEVFINGIRHIRRKTTEAALRKEMWEHIQRHRDMGLRLSQIPEFCWRKL